MNELSGTNRYSLTYFVIRGVYMNMCLNGVVDAQAKIEASIQDALRSHSISQSEAEDLLSFVSAHSGNNHTSEYIRLLGVITGIIESSGFIKPDLKSSLREEIDLAEQGDLLYQSEKEKLYSLLEEQVKNVVSITESTQRRVSPTSTPQRRKAAEKRSRHGSSYDYLVSEYKALYTSGKGDTKKFFDKVRVAYNEGGISIKEFRDFHTLLDDEVGMFVDALYISSDDSKFAVFRENFVDKITDDSQIEDIIRQVITWAIKQGTPTAAVMADLYKVALDNLAGFFNAGCYISTLGRKSAQFGLLREIQFS